MSRHVKREFRWDRIVLVVLVLIGCSSGMVALVNSPDINANKPKTLSHPEPLKKLKGYRIPEKRLAIASETSNTTVSHELTVSADTPNSNEVKLGSLLPCSCCKKTLRIPKNPYTRHQQSAR